MRHDAHMPRFVGVRAGPVKSFFWPREPLRSRRRSRGGEIPRREDEVLVLVFVFERLRVRGEASRPNWIAGSMGESREGRVGSGNGGWEDLESSMERFVLLRLRRLLLRLLASERLRPCVLRLSRSSPQEVLLEAWLRALEAIEYAEDEESEVECETSLVFDLSVSCLVTPGIGGTGGSFGSLRSTRLLAPPKDRERGRVDPNIDGDGCG